MANVRFNDAEYAQIKVAVDICLEQFPRYKAMKEAFGDSEAERATFFMNLSLVSKKLEEKLSNAEE